jgi:hypothetical protein
MSGMGVNIGLTRLRRQVPLSVTAAAIAARLARERSGLHDYMPAAISRAAEALAAAHAVADGHCPELRADRLPRYRRGQFLGEYGFPTEDHCAVMLESQLGRDVMLAHDRAKWAPEGYRITLEAAPAGELHSSLTVVMERVVAFETACVMAFQDNAVTSDEEALLAGLEARVLDALAVLRTTRAAARKAQR